MQRYGQHCLKKGKGKKDLLKFKLNLITGDKFTTIIMTNLRSIFVSYIKGLKISLFIVTITHIVNVFLKSYIRSLICGNIFNNCISQQIKHVREDTAFDFDFVYFKAGFL